MRSTNVVEEGTTLLAGMLNENVSISSLNNADTNKYESESDEGSACNMNESVFVLVDDDEIPPLDEEEEDEYFLGDG